MSFYLIEAETGKTLATTAVRAGYRDAEAARPEADATRFGLELETMKIAAGGYARLHVQGISFAGGLARAEAVALHRDRSRAE